MHVILKNAVREDLTEKSTFEWKTWNDVVTQADIPWKVFCEEETKDLRLGLGTQM